MCLKAPRITYSRDVLLDLGSRTKAAKIRLASDLWCSIVDNELRRPARGKRGCGLRKRRREQRERYKPILPKIVMGNVNSLLNKTDELAALVKYDRIYKETSAIILTETWITKTTTPDEAFELPGFSLIHADRDPVLTGKSKGGGVAVYINNRWCHPGHITIKEVICTENVELLAVGCRSYRQPREISLYLLLAVYIHPRAKPGIALPGVSVAQCVALSPHSKKVLGSIPGLSVRSLHVLPEFTWVSSTKNPNIKNMQKEQMRNRPVPWPRTGLATWTWPPGAAEGRPLLTAAPGGGRLLMGKCRERIPPAIAGCPHVCCVGVLCVSQMHVWVRRSLCGHNKDPCGPDRITLQYLML